MCGSPEEGNVVENGMNVHASRNGSFHAHSSLQGPIHNGQEKQTEGRRKGPHQPIIKWSLSWQKMPCAKMYKVSAMKAHIACPS